MSIPSSFIDRLLTSVNIIDIIVRRLQLERRGGGYWAKCPFHGSGEERTGSFKVYEDSGTYLCFGCKESGNAIHFLRKHDGLDFMEAIELLASSVGMEVPQQEKPVDVSDALNINSRAVEIFIDQLKSPSGQATIEYLKARGINGETAKFFELGYAVHRDPSLYSVLSPNYDRSDLELSVCSSPLRKWRKACFSGPMWRVRDRCTLQLIAEVHRGGCEEFGSPRCSIKCGERGGSRHACAEDG